MVTFFNEAEPNGKFQSAEMAIPYKRTPKYHDLKLKKDREGIVFFHALGCGWVLDVRLIDGLFPGSLKPPTAVEEAFRRILQDVLNP